MPVTTIDTETALIVVDLQKGIVFPRLGETVTTQEIIDLLAKGSSNK